MKPTIKNYLFLHVAFLIYSIIMVYMKWAAKFPIASISFFIAYFGLVILLFGYAILWQQVIKHFEISKSIFTSRDYYTMVNALVSISIWRYDSVESFTWCSYYYRRNCGGDKR